MRRYTENNSKIVFWLRWLCSKCYVFTNALCSHNGHSFQTKHLRSRLAKFPIFESFSVYFVILIFLAFKFPLFAMQDAILEEMTLEEKIGQLIVIPACQLRGEDHFEDLHRLITQYKIGGILLKQGTAQGQRALIEKLQKLSSLPLLCVQDGEWGVSMRLSDVLSFPRNLTLGAVQDLSLLYQLGQAIGRQCKHVGAHLNLAPVVDVNCNPQNPIIHMRSFGEDPIQVAERGVQVMRGIQATGVIACAKHFPGHGDTHVDSHVDLPHITHPLDRLKQVELYPFQKLIEAGVQAVMSAHLHVESLAEKTALPATFSSKIVTDLLGNQLGFKGLVISDALNMKALANYYSADQIAIQALLAGHDLLLYGDHIAPHIDQILRVDVPLAIDAIKAAVEKGEISQALIDAKVRKVLHAKRELKLFEKGMPTTGDEEINSPEAYTLKQKLFEEAMTLVRNEGLVPLKNENIANIVLIEWGETPVFKSTLEKAHSITRLSLEDPALLSKLQNATCFILALSPVNTAFPDFGLKEKEQAQLAALKNSKIPGVAVIFGTPYSLTRLPSFDALLVAYEKESEAQEAAANVILGHLKAKGRLPVSTPQFPAGTGL